MGTCSRCGTPRTGAERCAFCGMSFAHPIATPPIATPAAPAAPAAALPPAAETAPTAMAPPGSFPAPVNYPEPVTYPGPDRTDAAWTQSASAGSTTVSGTGAGSSSTGGGTDVGTVVGAAGQVLGIYLLACVVVTTVLALAVTDGHAGNPLNWFRGAVILAALGLHGTAFMSATVDGGSGFGGSGGLDGASAVGLGSLSGSLTLTVTPMLLLIGVLVLAYRAGRTGEHRSLSSNHRQALLSGAASGLVMTLALALLAVATRFDSTFGIGGFGIGPSMTVGAKVLPLFLYGFPMLAGAFAAGRSITHRQVYGLPTLRDEVHSRTHGVSDWLQPAVLHAGITAAFFAVIAFGYGVTHSGSEFSSFSLLSVSGLLMYLLFSANAGLFATALFMGVSGVASGSSTLFGIGPGGEPSGLGGGAGNGAGGGDRTVGLFHGDLGGVDFLWLLIPPLLALVVGIRQAYRSPVSPWWQGGLASLGLWFALAFLLRVSFSAGSDGLSLDTSFGLELLTLGIVSFGYGALVQHAGRALAGPLRTNAPNAAHALGYHLPATAAPLQHQLWS